MRGWKAAGVRRVSFELEESSRARINSTAVHRMVSSHIAKESKEKESKEGALKRHLKRACKTIQNLYVNIIQHLFIGP